MTREAGAVAAIAAEIVQAKFAESDEKQLMLVKGFLPEEFTELALALISAPTFKPTVLVITSRKWPELPESAVLPEGMSVTWYRNRPGSYVFLQAEEFSDLSGMSFAYHVNDGTILGQRVVHPETAMSCLRHVWRRSNEGADPPGTLRGAVMEIVSTYVDIDCQVSLRRWIRFLVHLTETVEGGSTYIDAKTARTAVASSLHALGLFPDAVLRDVGQQIPRMRRLRENLLASMDRKSNGKEFDREDLAAVLPALEFVDPVGHPLTAAENGRIRGKLQRYLTPHAPPSTEGIEFHYWQQLFLHRTKRKGLGTRIREHLEAEDGDAVDVFDGLDILEALDSRDSEAAKEFLDSEDEAGAPLYSLIPDSLQRQVEKLANPRAPVSEHPLRDVIRIIRDFSSDEDGLPTVVMKPRTRHGQAVDDRFSKALFAFLFGPTLKAVVARTEGHLSIDPALLDFGPLRAWISHLDGGEDDDETEPRESEWGPLEIQIESTDGGDAALLRWEPAAQGGWIALARTIATPAEFGWRLGNATFDSFVSASIDSAGLPGSLPTPDSELARDWIKLRANHFLRLWENGLDVDALGSYCDEWGSILRRAREAHVPKGSADPAIGEFLTIDVFEGSPDSRVLLASHPLRLRWLISSVPLRRGSNAASSCRFAA